MPLNDITRFRIRDPEGNLITYSEGDVVERNGNIYVAIRRTSGYDPRHGEQRAGWKLVTSNRIEDFDHDTTAPLNPDEGDKWLDPSTGILFFRITNTDGSGSWVEF